MFVLVTPLDSVDESTKEEGTVEKKVPESAKEDSAEKAEEKKPSSAEQDAVDASAVSDYSGAFDLASSLVNNFKFTLNRLHIRLEGNPTSPIPLFSLGIALDSIILDTRDVDETCHASDIRKGFDLNGLVVYWCLDDKALLSQVPEELCLVGMRSFFKDYEAPEGSPKSPLVYNPDDRLLDNLHMHVSIYGDLRKTEDRRRSLEDCLTEVCEKLGVSESDPVDQLVLEQLRSIKSEDELLVPRSEFALRIRNELSKKEHYFVKMGLRAREVAEAFWETSKTPSPMLRVNVEVDKIDLEIEKSQYENIACFLDDFLASLPASQPEPTVVVEEVKEEKKEEAKEEPGVPHYVFGVVSFVCYVANYLLTSYVPFVSLLTLLCVLPYMLFHNFLQFVLLLLALGAGVAFAFWRLKKRTEAYNSRVDKEVHYRNQLVNASFLMKAFELRLNNDMVGGETEHIMALCVNDLGVSASVTKSNILASLVLQDVHINDQVSSLLQKRDRQLMCVCDIDEQGCPSNAITKPLLKADVTMALASSPVYALSDQDILVGVEMGQVNFVVSRVLIYSLLRFIAPSPKVKELLKKAAIKADEKAKELKEYSDQLVAAPPKPIPADWERRTIVLNLRMDAARALLDSETGGIVMCAEVSALNASVTMCAASINVFCSIHDVAVVDGTSGHGLYPKVVAIDHPDNAAQSNFLDAGIRLFNDDRWEQYPGYSLEAKCSIGAPILTVRMRFIQELLNYISYGPIKDGLDLMSEPEEEALTASGNLPELEATPNPQTQIVENLKDCAYNIGMQYIVTNGGEGDGETHIMESLQGIAENLKRKYIVPNPNDDLVPTEIPRVDVVIANTCLRVPRSSDSPDYVAIRMGCLTINNSNPETMIEDEKQCIRKESVVYTLNKIALKISGVSMYTELSGLKQTIMGSIDLAINLTLAVKVELSLVLSRIVLAVSEDQVLTLIHLLTQNLAEKAITMEALPAASAPAPAKKAIESSENPERTSDILARASKRMSSQMCEAKAEAKAEEDAIEEVDSDDSGYSGVLPRSGSSTSLNSSCDLTESVVPLEEQRPVENNTAFADRIHANILLEGVIIELFRGNSGYEGIQSSKEMEKQIGTVEGSLAVIAIEDLGVKAYYHNMDISAAVTLSSFFIKDSRPESPLMPSYRTLLQLGDKNKPAFTLLVGLQQKTLGDLHNVKMRSEHKVNEPVFNVETSLFLGNVNVLPSPWIFVMLDWATVVGGKVSTAFAEATSSEKVETSEEKIEATSDEKVVASEEKEENLPVEKSDDTKAVTTPTLPTIEEDKEQQPAALIPNVIFKMHMERMALYMVEDTTSSTSPVFLFCFGVEVAAHISPYMDVDVTLSVNNTRGCRSNSMLELLPTDMRDAIYPFGLTVTASVYDNIKDIRAKVIGSEMVIRLGILDAKLLLNAIGNLMPKTEETDAPKEAEKEASPKETEKEASSKETKEVKKEEDVKKETSKEDVMRIMANVVLNKITFILVNDAFEFELPVLQFNVNQVKVDAAMGSNLYAHVAVSFSSDYYKASQALWEPFMEYWTVNVNVKQIKDILEKDPFISRESQENEVASETMKVNVEGAHMLQMNVTATLLSSLMDALNAFLGCSSGVRQTGDGFFVRVNNATGYPMKYVVEKDGGISQLMEQLEEHAAEEEKEDHVKYADVVDVVEPYRTCSRWMEFHTSLPHIRFYQHIPLLMDTEEVMEHNMVMKADQAIPSDATCGHVFPIAFTVQKNERTLYVEQLDDAHCHAMVSHLNELAKEAETPKVMERSESSYHNTWREVPEGGAATVLPAHPSLALLFLKQNYRSIPGRSVKLQVEGFEPISCLVDREHVVYQPMKSEDGRILNALLRNSVRNGRKTIELTSTISVTNNMDQSVKLSFVDSSNDVKDDMELKVRTTEFCPLRLATTAVIKLHVGEYAGVEIPVAYLEKKTVARCVNLGDSSHPLYARAIIKEETVYDIYNKDYVMAHTLTLVPVIQLMNLLPEPMEYRLYNVDKRIVEGSIEEGEEVKLNDAPILADTLKDVQLRIAIRPKGFDEFTVPAESIIPFPQEKTQSVFLRDPAGHKLRLTCKVVQSNLGVTTIQVYCDFWLVNCTGETITVMEKEDDSQQWVLPAVSTKIVAVEDYHFDKTKNMKPIMFSYLHPESRSRAMVLRSDHTSFSDGVTIDALGTNTRFCMPAKKDPHAKEKKIFGVNVVNGPMMFALTNVVVITPGVFLLNKTDKDLSLRLGTKESSPITTLSAGKTIVYHCPTAVDKIAFCVKCEALGSEWTEPIDITKEEENRMLVLPNDPDAKYLLRMRAGMDASQREVVFDFADAFNTFLFLESQKKKKLLSLSKKDEEEEVRIADLLEESDKAMEGLTTEESLQHLKVMTRMKSKEKDVEKKDDSIQVEVKFAGFGISVITKKPEELMYICAEDLSVQFHLGMDGKIVAGVSLMKCQIDSGLKGSKYKVILGSTEAGQPNEEYNPEDPQGMSPFKPFFELSLSMPSHPTVTIVEYLAVCIQPMVCAMDSTIITSLLDVVNDITVSMQDVGKVKGHSVIESFPMFAPANVITAKVGRSYILADNFILQPINIKFSFSNNSSASLSDVLLPQDPRWMPFIAMFNTFTNLVGNLDNATIALRSLILTNYYTDMNAFTKKVVLFYGKEILQKFYLLAGSFNLIGNPVELVGNVADGVKAFFTEPVQGLMRGPTAFVGGLGKGTTKLVSQTAYGVLNSVSKITSTVSNGIASLAMSDQYQADRAAGKSNLVHGVWSGVTGVFTETGSGLKEEGLIGGLKGLGKGIVGAGAKVVTGAIDTVTHVVDNVKDVAHKEKVVEPLRSPRYIPLDDVLEPYNRHLSDGGVLLQKANSESGIRVLPTERYVVHCTVNNGMQILLLTTFKVVLLSGHGKLLGVAPFSNVEVIRKGQEMKLIPRDSKDKNELLKNVGNVVNSIASNVDGELHLKECDLLLESTELAELVEQFITNRLSMTNDQIADMVRKMIKEIHAEASQEEETSEEEDPTKRPPPVLENLEVGSVSMRGHKRMEVKGDKEVKKQVTMYRAEVTSKGEERAKWNIYFRYYQLDDLFKELKSKCNKEDLKNLHLTSQRLKFLRTKNQREDAVRRFLDVLSSSENLMSQEEVGAFLKNNAYGLHWEDETMEDESDVVMEEVDSESSVC